jgi:hypothetical protein
MKLGELLSFVTGRGASSTPAAPAVPTNDRRAYLDYVEVVQVQGGQPLKYQEWIAAGRPAK